METANTRRSSVDVNSIISQEKVSEHSNCASTDREKRDTGIPQVTEENAYKRDISYDTTNNSNTNQSALRGERFKCNVCSYTSNKGRNLKRHMSIHSEEKRFKCKICDYACSRKESLKRHMRSHTGEKYFKCDICDYACSRSDNLKIHMVKHARENYNIKCGSIESANKQDSSVDANLTVSQQTMSELSNFANTVREGQNTHMQTIEKDYSYKSDISYNTLSNSNALQHTVREKCFKCSFCSYTSNWGSHLKRHMAIHSGEKRFKCYICDYACNISCQLKIHMRIHTGEKCFKCKLCDYACNERVKMNIHLRIHTGEKPFKCNVCDYACSRNDSLKTHMRIHTGEKCFKCDVCDYACNQSGHLQTHMRIHTGEKPFKCDVCDYASSRSDHMRTHMKIHTRKK